jgi:transmembrane sensor
MENEEYIRRWIEGSLSEEEKQRFERTETYKSFEKLIDSLKVFRAPEYPVEEELGRLQSSLQKKKKSIHLNLFYRIAATLIILAGIYYSFIYKPETHIETGIAEKHEFYLPDSSRVVLNAQSRLTYNEGRWDGNREVKLEGEAFFSVNKGSDFEVLTRTRSVKVLGTQFNVKSRPDYFEVTCYEGLVGVGDTGEMTPLSPHQMYRVIQGKIQQFNDIPEPSPGWIDRESSFRSVPYIQVIHEFERQYNVNIRTENVDTDQLFTGRFVNSDIELAINSITIPMNLGYLFIDDQNIVLSPDHN